MSRYKTQKDHLILNYGYDHALGYWYDIQDTSQLDEEGNPKLIDEQCSFEQYSLSSTCIGIG